MPSVLEQLPLPELQSLAEALTAEPESRRTVLKAVQLTAISVEVGRRLGEAEDTNDAATLRMLEQMLRQWLDNDRRMRGWNDDDDDGGFSGGTCMCSIARGKSGRRAS